MLQVRIDFDATDPPYGLIEREGAEVAERFEGWLGLVTSLEALLAHAETPQVHRSTRAVGNRRQG